MVYTLEQIQVPNGTGQGARRSKRPLCQSDMRKSSLCSAQFVRELRHKGFRISEKQSEGTTLGTFSPLRGF